MDKEISRYRDNANQLKWVGILVELNYGIAMVFGFRTHFQENWTPSGVDAANNYPSEPLADSCR